MVKPLDVGQIVPTVDDAFARLRSGPAPAPAQAPAAPAANDALADVVPLALGVLMHRHSLTRAQAHQRLQRLAGEQGLSEAAQAERLLAALEELARS
jgi:response regulator NasT